MKDDLPYFGHDNNSSDHPKMMALRAQFGWAGYGQFWALNEAIARGSGARLDLSKKVNKATLAVKLGLSMADFDTFLAFLSDPEECGLIHLENGIVTTDRTQEDLERVMAERARNRDKAKTVTRHVLDENEETTVKEQNTTVKKQNTTVAPRLHHGENPHSRVEKRRVEEEALGFEANLDPEFAGSEKSDREKYDPSEYQTPPEPDLPAFSTHPSVPDLRVPRGLSFTGQQLIELKAMFGTRSQEALETIAAIFEAKDYGYKSSWGGAKMWIRKEPSAEVWLDKATGKTRPEASTVRPEIYRPFVRAPDDGDPVDPSELEGALRPVMRRAFG